MGTFDGIMVFAKCRLPLKWMNLCNKNGFYIRNYKVPHLLATVVLGLPIVYAVVMDVWLCAEYNFDLLKVSGTVVCTVGNGKLLIIYAVLAWMNPVITEMIDHIQSVVDRSMDSYLKFSFLKIKHF